MLNNVKCQDMQLFTFCQIKQRLLNTVKQIDMVVCHKLVLKSVSYPKIVKNTPILIEQSITCNVYT